MEKHAYCYGGSVCVWKTIIGLDLGKKADIITKYKQQQQQQEKASEVTVIIGYTKWHGGPQLKEMKQTHTYNRNMETDGSRWKQTAAAHATTAAEQAAAAADGDLAIRSQQRRRRRDTAGVVMT